MTANDLIRLMLVEDHDMVRAGFRMLLEAQPDMLIVAETDSGETALALAKATQPDVVLLDVSMPGLGGQATARSLRASMPQLAILAVTIHESKAYLLEMLDAGVNGYLPKRAAAEELVQAIRTVHAGRVYVHPQLVGALVEGYRGQAEPDGPPTRSRSLTERQLQVLRLIADGQTSHDIASRLGLSVRTVDRHVENMMNRLGIRSRVELVRHAVSEGLIDLRQ